MSRCVKYAEALVAYDTGDIVQGKSWKCKHKRVKNIAVLLLYSEAATIYLVLLLKEPFLQCSSR